MPIRRALVFLVLVMTLLSGLVTSAFAEGPASPPAPVPVPVVAPEPFLTLGYTPPSTDQDTIFVRGTAPIGKIAAIAANDELVARVIAGPSMAVYKYAVPLRPGANRIVVTLEGTELAVEASVFRTTRTFKDIADHWARRDIEMLATLEVVNGIGDDEFGPELTLTRAQFAKLVVAGLGLAPDAAPALAFGDAAAVPEWARGYVAVAVAHGLIKGFEDGTFRAGDPVTRAQVTVIAARALREKAGGALVGAGGAAAPVKAFADSDRIPGWARADVDFTVQAGLVGDFWGDSFQADGPATRALAAAVIRRLRTSW